MASILPALLPTVFTVSVGISDDRLANNAIACTNSESILVAGKVTRAFFDKTGTITKQGLDFLCSRSIASWREEKLPHSEDMALAMASCHSLTPSKLTGKFVGNPVDRVMFEASGANIDKRNAENITDAHGKKVLVVKRFDFDHHRMTQSVIVKTEDETLTVFVKGSGESMKKLCLPESLPDDFDAVVKQSARSGVYQITMAKKIVKSLDLGAITRDDVECDLEFVGVINFKNVIREDSADVIQQLEDGEIESIMVTGDSVLTGICIGKEAGIIKPGRRVLVGSLEEGGIVWRTEDDEKVDLPSVEDMKTKDTVLAMSGAAFDHLWSEDPVEAGSLLSLVRVYGRCTPYDKVAVVSAFVNAGYITLMAGDGGNVSFIECYTRYNLSESIRVLTGVYSAHIRTLGR